MKYVINKLSALFIMLMCVSATVQAEIVHHEVCQPKVKSRGFTRECWEDTETGKFYANAACTEELVDLALAKAVTYLKQPENPITDRSGFSFAETEHLNNVIKGENIDLDLNWSVSTTFQHASNSYIGEEHRFAEFTVKGKQVSNARIVWFSENNFRSYGNYTVVITINGTVVLNTNQLDGLNYIGKETEGVCVLPFDKKIQSYLGRDLMEGDKVMFQVFQKSSYSQLAGGPTFKASLEYTNLPATSIVRHMPCAPTLTSRGFTRECWEEKETGKIYADANCTQEITDEALAKAVIYPKLPKSPVKYLNEFGYPEDINYRDVNMNYSVSTSFDVSSPDIVDRYAEFLATGDNVANARLVWSSDKNYYPNSYIHIYIYVNNVQNGDVILTGDYAWDNYIFVQSLPELKKGDVVKFRVWSTRCSEILLRASLEYIGTFDNDDSSPIVYHAIQKPTENTPFYTRECWENRTTGKFYTNAACTQELKDLDLAKAVIYAKLPANPITSTNGFGQSEKETDWDVDLNWAGVTSYSSGLSKDSRWVEFKASTKKTQNKVVNARLVWNKNCGDPHNGLYRVNIYVNDVVKYSITQGSLHFLEGVFVLPLPTLKTNDIVRFEVTQTGFGTWGGPTFKASLEYYVVPCTHEYAAGSAVCSMCGYVKAHDHTYHEAETCSQCGAIDPTYTVLSGYVGKDNLNDIKWVLNKYNVLTFTGKGEMEPCNAEHNGWREYTYRSGITKIVIGEGITKIGDGNESGSYFNGMSNLTDVFLMSDKEVSAEDDVFGDNITKVTLHVNNDVYFWAKTTSPWNRFKTIVLLNPYNIKYTDAENNIHEMLFNTAASDNTFTLTDGCKRLAIFEDIPMQTLTYTRNFSAANTWQALCVPFEMEYSDWADKFDVAAISNFHEYTNENGVTEKIDLEVRYVKSGKLRANTPYLIRAKAAGEQTIVLNNATLKATEPKSIDCSSTERRYTFTGTYDAIDGLQTKNYIFISGGRLSKSNNNTDVLKPMRWYLTIEDYFSVTGSPAPALAKPMSINVIDDGETTGIIQIENEELKSSTDIYNLNSMRLTKPQKGINIINGKKIVVK